MQMKSGMGWLVRMGVMAAVLALPAVAQVVHINEIMSSNVSTVQDEDGTYSDWVEVYNPGAAPVSLLDWGLTDSASTPFKWRFGDVTIQPGEFLVVWASSKNRPAVTNGNAIHTSWAISSGGEDIVLTRPDGSTASFFGASIIGADRSYGRKPDGTGPMHFFDVATPGAANTTVGIPADLPIPGFSVPSGIYTNGQVVEISTTVPGGQIRYTLDGSEPTTNSPLYTGAITVTVRSAEANLSLIPTNDSDPGPPYYEGWQPPLGDVFRFRTVRAKVFVPGSTPSKAATRSYVITPEGTSRYSMPIVSINTDEKNFFDPNIGIYVKGNNNNYMQDGSAWERPGSLELIDTNGVVQFQNNVGIRLHGTTTVTRPRKGLRIYMRDPGTLNAQVYPDKPVNKFNTFILRAGGNDWGNALIRDVYAQSLISHFTLDRQSTRAVVVFLNGEYWGVHHIRDRFDEGYILNHYGLSESEFVQMEADLAVSQQLVYDRGYEPMAADWHDFFRFLNEQRAVSSSNYEVVKTRMDVGNFIDYTATEIFVGNTDWPGNNIKLWRSVATNTAPNAPYGHDGRWRWMIYDTDFSFGADFFYVPGWSEFASYNSIAHAAAANGVHFSNKTNATLVFRRLLENTDFRAEFVSRFSDHLNSAFKKDRLLAQLDKVQAEHAPEIAEHVRRWRQPVDWTNDMQRIRNYANLRTEAVWGHLQSFFNLGDRRDVTVDVSDARDGTVQVNSIEITPSLPGVSASVYPWTGSYFTNTPMKLTAKAKPGYRFVKWVDGQTGAEVSTNEVLAFTHGDAASYTAVFAVDQAGLVPQPFDLGTGSFTFTEWDAAAPAGTYPANMIFEQVGSADPALAVAMDSYWVLPYNLTSRSRINGQGTNGLSFINTGDKVALPGSGFLGSAVAAVSTIGRSNVTVSFTTGTIIPNFRTYALRLQYRVGATGPFLDVLDNGQPVEYVRNATAGHVQSFGPVALPEAANNQSYVQIRWKYHYIETGITGARPQIRLDDIVIASDKAPMPPVAKASGTASMPATGGTAWLNGSLSKDLDGTIASYAWTQIAGPAVTISNADQAVAQAAIPARAASASYGFQLVVTDNDGFSATGLVTVSQSVNLAKTYSQMYFRGTPNSWGTTAMTLVSNYTWEITATFGAAASQRFKFDVYGDWSTNFGDNNNDGIGDLDATLDIPVTQGAGDYRIRFNDQTRRYWISKIVANAPPVANGGGNRTVSPAGEVITFNGGASTDPDGFIAAFAWSQVSGPAASISNAESAFPVVTIPAGSNGTVYVFRLLVTDNEGLSATGTVTVTQQVAKNYNQVYFRGTPNGWGTTLMTLVSNHVWETQAVFGNTATERFKFDVNGDWSLNFGDTNADGTAEQSGANINVTQGAGTYTIRFNDLTRRYWVIKQIVNVPPVAHAGADQTVSLDGGIRPLNGSASTDSDGTIVSYVWSQVSGPVLPVTYSNVILTTVNIPASASPAVYVFSLVVMDNSGASSTGTVSITQQNIAPVANAGTNQTIQLAGGTVSLIGTNSTDADGSIASYAWSQVSGPAVTLTNETTSIALAEIPAQTSNTVYTFALVVTDNHGASASGTVTVTQSAPQLMKTYNQVFFRGTPNGWGTLAMTLVSNYTWETQVTFGSSANERFKFDASGNWTVNFGDNNNDGLAELSGANIAITQGAGVYLIRFNDQTRQYWRIKQVVNQPPVANGGGNRTAALAGEVLTFNGGASTDPDGFIASFAWSQVSGPAASISNAASAFPVVTIPAGSNGTLYVFQLVVTDNQGLSATGTVTVTQSAPQLMKTYNQVFFRGTANGWGTTVMTLVSNYVWEIEATFGPGSTERFKFDVNGDWTLNFGDNNNDGLAEQSGGNIMIAQGSGTYRIRFNDQTRRYWVYKNGTGFLSAYSSMTMAGSFNGWNPAANNMTLVDHYTWQYDVVLFSSIQFKFVANGAWAAGNWGDLNPSGTTVPLNGIAEAGAANIAVSTALSGAYRIVFNEQTRAFSLQAVPSVANLVRSGATYTTPWEKLYQINLLDPVQRAQDPDGDGLKNLTEYYQDIHPYDEDSDGDRYQDRDELMAGTDPRLVEDYLSAEVVHLNGALAVVWTGAADRSYVVEAVADPAAGTWTPVSAILAGVAGAMSADVTDAIEDGAAAFRVRVLDVLYPPE